MKQSSHDVTVACASKISGASAIVLLTQTCHTSFGFLHLRVFLLVPPFQLCPKEVLPITQNS